MAEREFSRIVFGRPAGRRFFEELHPFLRFDSRAESDRSMSSLGLCAVPPL
jgi:hypothetical protein